MMRGSLTHIKDTTKLYLLQDGLCFYCRKEMTNGVYGCKRRKLGWTIDHLIPKSAGGNGRFNKVLCHYECNREKSNRLPTDEEQLLYFYAIKLGLGLTYSEKHLLPLVRRT